MMEYYVLLKRNKILTYAITTKKNSMNIGSQKNSAVETISFIFLLGVKYLSFYKFFHFWLTMVEMSSQALNKIHKLEGYCAHWHVSTSCIQMSLSMKEFLYFFIFYFIFGHTHSTWKFLGKGSNLNHSGDQSHCSVNTISLATGNSCAVLWMQKSFSFISSSSGKKQSIWMAFA